MNPSIPVWEATEKAEAPRPKPHEPFIVQAVKKRLQPAPPRDLPAGTHLRKLSTNGTFMLDRATYMVGGQYFFQQVLVIIDSDHITVADLDGEILIEHTRAAPGITYVGNGRPPGGPRLDPTASPMS